MILTALSALGMSSDLFWKPKPSLWDHQHSNRNHKAWFITLFTLVTILNKESSLGRPDLYNTYPYRKWLQEQYCNRKYKPIAWALRSRPVACLATWFRAAHPSEKDAAYTWQRHGFKNWKNTLNQCFRLYTLNIPTVSKLDTLREKNSAPHCFHQPFLHYQQIGVFIKIHGFIASNETDEAVWWASVIETVFVCFSNNHYFPISQSYRWKSTHGE